jgi:hypothetical protein
LRFFEETDRIQKKNDCQLLESHDAKKTFLFWPDNLKEEKMRKFRSLLREEWTKLLVLSPLLLFFRFFLLRNGHLTASLASVSLEIFGKVKLYQTFESNNYM